MQMQEVHVSKISNSKQFSLGQIKQFLPIHQQTVVDNLRIIFNNYAISNYPLNIILIPDNNLKLEGNPTYAYTHLRAIWSEDLEDNPQKLRSTLNLGCALLNYIGSIDEESITEEKEKDVESWVTRADILTAKNAQKIQQRLKLYGKIKQTKKILGFNVILERGRIVLIIGVNIHANQSFILSCFLLRQWNLGRLKAVQMGSEIDVELMHRICEHLFSIGRGFVREAKSDYNTYRVGVNELLKKLGDSEFNKDAICQLMKSQKLSTNNLPHDMLILRWQVTYRKQIDQHMLWELICSLVTEWLLQTPVSCSCSYGSHVVIDEAANSLCIYLASYFQASPSKGPLNELALSNCIKQVQALLIDFSNKKQIVQSNSLKNSLNLLMKYQAIPDKNEITLSRQITPSDDSYSNNSLNDSFVSQISNESISQKINLKDIAKMQNQIYQILKTIHSKKSILTPSEIEDAIRKYVRKLQSIYPPCPLADQQYEALCTLDAINELLESQQIYLIVKKNTTQSSLVLSYFMPKGKYQRAMQIGRLIAGDQLEDLYKKCLQNGLSPSKHTIIPYYLKKIVQFYADRQPPSPQIKVDQISIPHIVQIIESKNYNSPLYSSIMEIIFPQIFKDFFSIIKILSPLLAYFIQLLTNHDHHEQLIFSFIGELIFEVCYFPSQIKLNSLSNIAYMEEKNNKSLSLKEKKILDLIREGGMKGFGFQVKQQLSQIIEANKMRIQNEEMIYHMIKADKPGELQLLFKLLSSCHYTASTDKIAKYLEHKNYFSQALNRSNPLLCFLILKNKQTDYKFQVKKEINSIDDSQFNSISERILRSQSGIFQQMIKLNPQVKIAGIQLKTVMKNLTDSRNGNSAMEKPKGQLDEHAAVQAYINKQFKQNYEYVSLAWSLKEKYLKYPSLSESEKTYFRDCATVVIDHKNSIIQYVALSAKIRNLKKSLKESEQVKIQLAKTK